MNKISGLEWKEMIFHIVGIRIVSANVAEINKERGYCTGGI